MNEIFGTIATILAVTGVLFNNRKMIACFYLWFASNLITAWLHAGVGLWSLLVRDLMFLALVIEGFWKWQRK